MHRSARCGWFALCLAIWISPAQVAAAERGWLKFRDGNVIAGSLRESTSDGGVFDADRFGRIQFSTAGAAFEPAMPPAVAAAPEAALPSPDQPRGWAPDKWSLTFAADWKKENENTEYDLAGDVTATWARPRDEVTASVRVDYKIHNDKVDTNMQTGRLRWFHTVDSPWLMLGQLYVEHDRITVADRPLEYAFTQMTVGPGFRLQWNADSYSRVALGFNRFYIRFPEVNVDAYESEGSVFADNFIRLTQRLSFRNWLNWYWYPADTDALEAESEFNYAVTEQFSVGLWHRYRDRGIDIHNSSVNEFRIFTRVTF